MASIMMKIDTRDSPVSFGPSRHPKKRPCRIVSDAKD